jgi:SAM-dependent methyltransferase
MSRYLASLEAAVTGIDISAAMLGKARAVGPENITYIHADVTRHPAWWDGRPFDGCTCELALMDVDDLAVTLSTVTAVLRPGGWFVASIVHPCFPGNELGRSSWPPGQGYESEGRWTSPNHNPDGDLPGRCDTPQAVHLPECPA